MTKLLLLSALAVCAFAQDPSYVLGPDDQLIVRALDIDEFKDVPAVRVDLRGNINLPLVGRVEAAGHTVEQLEAQVAERLKAWLVAPQVTIQIADFRSQPVSILGAVNNPGVIQLQGRKTLFEVLSLANGLKPEAGAWINITRPKSSGPIALATAKDDPTGQFSVASISLKSIMEAKNPAENIQILPNDVISVPKADLVYVVGCVKKAGGFVLNERETLSVLQALSLAEGLDRTAAPKEAKILRQTETSARLEIPVNVKSILAGKSPDVNLGANDILFVPNSAGKSALFRGAEAALTVGTGLAIYRR